MRITRSKLKKIIREEAAYVGRLVKRKKHMESRVMRAMPKVIREHKGLKAMLQEDWRDPEGSRYTVHKAMDAEEPGMMGIDPVDMKQQLLQQFSTTANALVKLLKEVRIMREMAGEMSQMEAEGALDGDFGTRMWHGVQTVDRLARSMVRDWNSLNDIT